MAPKMLFVIFSSGPINDREFNETGPKMIENWCKHPLVSFVSMKKSTTVFCCKINIFGFSNHGG